MTESGVPERVLQLPEIKRLHKKLLKTERKRLKLELKFWKGRVQND